MFIKSPLQRQHIGLLDWAGSFCTFMPLIWRDHGPLFNCKRTAALYRHEAAVSFRPLSNVSERCYLLLMLRIRGPFSCMH